jgi:hypothetical protein
MVNTSAARSRTQRALQRLQRIVQKYNKLLTIVGALIVFIMYVVKDTQKEKIRDLADEINSAESVFVVSTSLDDVRMKLAYSTFETTNLIGFSVKRESKNVMLVHEVDGGLVGLMTSSLQEADHLVEIVSRLAERIDDREAVIALGKLKHEIGPLWPRIEALNKLSDQRPFQNKEILESIELADSSGLLWQKASFIKVDVFKHAEGKRKKTEDDYKFYTTLSHVLYFVGWSLALVGHFFGVNSGISPE